MTTVARPYAAAAFEYALAKQDIPAWETMLQAAANLTQNPAVISLLVNPKVTKSQLADLFCEMLAPFLNAERTNFIRLVADKKRLSNLADVAQLFQTARAALEKTINVEVVSAVELDDIYQQKLTKALTKRLQRQVHLQTKIDPNLLGGAIVRAGDIVIDGSVRGKLTRLIDFI